ncbi:MAG TPA: DUF1501 domain-containing protein [Acidimicrobiales bacterium]|nr:DUF1501 domain-containing protein [Acidimicrobiales bacterium]
MAGGLSRRQFIAGAGGMAGATLLAPVVLRGGAWMGEAIADPATAARRRLVVVFLQGGNDGLNTVIPTGDVRGAPRYSVYRKVRPSIAYDRSQPFPLGRGADAAQQLGLNPRLGTLHRLYDAGRMAIVQGVDYPHHSYSHFTSADLWHAGAPDGGPDSGWLGRHLDRVGMGEGELRAVGVGTELPLMLRGHDQLGGEIASLSSMVFADGNSPATVARHQALAAFAGYPSSDPVRHAAGVQAGEAVTLVDRLARAPRPAVSPRAMTNSMLTARTLLEQDLGVECVFVPQPASYDNHAAQRSSHEAALSDLDAGIEAFFFGTEAGVPLANTGPMNADVAARTLVMVVSEFGRRIGENGSGSIAGTDHGAAAPVMLIGPPPSAAFPKLVEGLHGDHPPMGTPTAPADNLTMTTDLRSVYQAVLTHWLNDPDPIWGRNMQPLPGLFQPPPPPPAPPKSKKSSAKK